MNTLLICSGGLDSVTLAYRLAASENLSAIISYNYGQKHVKELEFAKKCAHDLNVAFQLIDLRNLLSVLSNSALTSQIAVPDGHYAEQNMKITEVPNRNAIFLTIAFAAAANMSIDQVALAVHGGDHFIYPDCRPDFLASFDKMEQFALESKVRLFAPYAEYSKADIVKEGTKYHVPFQNSWSCYKGGQIHCGRCGTCVERKEAFALANVKDPTEYADNEYWQIAIRDYKKSQENN